MMSLLPLAVMLPVLSARRHLRFGSESPEGVAASPQVPVGWIAIGLLIGFALFENPLINAPWPLGKTTLQRGENWRLALQELPAPPHDQAMLFLFPNLVEDGRLIEDHGSEFETYTSFPLHALYRLPTAGETGHAWTVLPRPTIRSPRLRDEDVRRLVEQRFAFVVVRGSLELATAILDEFADELSPYGMTFDALVDVYGTVVVIEVTLTEF
jgi:hypothetical protein